MNTWQRIARWLRETWQPDLKCQRVGCDWHQITIRGVLLTGTGRWRDVADSLTVNLYECQRCGSRRREDPQ